MRTIRNSAKALIIHDGKILLSKLDDGEIFYILPGGGQDSEELLPDAVTRECAEELGVDVRPGALVFVIEGMHGEPFHRVDLVFLCDYIGMRADGAMHWDNNQVGAEWVSIDDLHNQPLYPRKLRNAIQRLYRHEETEVYLGNESMGE